MKLPKDYVPGVGVVKPTGGYGGFGQKMLEKMGWAEGQGLGKEKHGMKAAIEVQKKEDTLGVGAKQSTWQWDWKYWEDAYNSAAKSIKSHNSSDSTSSSSDSGSSGSDSDTPSSSSSSSSSSGSSDSDSSDDEQVAFAAIAAAASSSMHRDGTSCSASQAELKLAAQLAKDPWGRFGGRDGKLARIKRQEEEQAAAARAKLGLAPAPSPPAEAPSSSSGSKKRKAQADASPEPGRRSSKGSQEQQKSSSSEPAGQQQQQVQVQQPPRKVVVVQIGDDSRMRAAAAAFQPTPAKGWWGASMFASAGLLEGMEEAAQHVARERQGFDEDTQADLYMKTHEAQRQGRRGLGKSTTLKIAGGAWAGKKVAFAEEEDAEQQQGQEQATGKPAKHKKGKEKVKKKVQQQQQEEEEEEEEQQQQQAGGDAQPTPCSSGAGGAASSSGSRPGTKWAKLAVQQLQAAPKRRLKWKKLWPLLWEAAQQRGGSMGLREQASCQAAALARLQQSKKVVVEGKLVSLV